MSGKPLRVLGIEIDLSGKKAKDDLADWNREVREALGLADEYTDGVDDMAREMRDYAKRIGLTKEQLRELQETSKRNRDFGDFAKKYGLSMNEIQQKTRDTKEAIGGLADAMTALAAAGIGAKLLGGAGEMVELAKKAERTGITFEVMLKSKDKARETLNMLKEFSDITPFSDTEAIMAGRQLINAKVPLDQLKQTLTDIGNVAAGSEVPFNELAEIYAKNKMSGVIQLEDINQLAGRGLPIMDALGKAMGVQSTQIRSLTSSGAVNFGHLQKAFQIMSRDDYPGLMDRLSGSAAGLSSTFDSKLSSFKKTIGDLFLEGLKPLYVAGIAFLDWLQKTPAAMITLKIAILALIPVAALFFGSVLFKAIKTMGLLRIETIKFAASMVMAFLPIYVIIAALLALALIFEDLWVWMEGGQSLLGKLIDKGGVLGGVIKWLTAPMRLLVWVVRDIWNAFHGGPSVIMGVFGKIKGFFVSIYEFFKQYGKFFIMAIFPVSAIYFYWDQIAEFIKSIPDRIVSFIKSIPDRIMSILSGIKEMLKNLLPPAVMSLLVKTGFMDDTKQIKARAGGGDINAGDEYVVGEDGPELFRSDRAGTIIPNHALGGGRKSTSITLAPVFNISGAADPERIAALAIKKMENMLPLVAAELGFGLS